MTQRIVGELVSIKRDPERGYLNVLARCPKCNRIVTLPGLDVSPPICGCGLYWKFDYEVFGVERGSDTESAREGESS